tara:strand:- start:120 stop:530 length:411 start_codon:yes stop_codon:yes gene_type:complete
MNNNNFEFKSYIATPNDQYMLGVAKVKLYGKVVANFKHVKTKDGSGDFFCSASYSIQDATGEKKYLPCVMLDSRDDEEELLNFIRVKSHEAIALKSAHKAQQAAPAAGAYYPHGLAQQTQPAAPISEGATNDNLPF